MPKPVEDIEVRRNLHGILKEFGAIMKPDVVVSTDRDKLVDDLCIFIRRCPFNVAQGKALLDAITARMKHKTCCSCGRLKPELGGKLTWVDGDMSKPKRFVCGECYAR